MFRRNIVLKLWLAVVILMVITLVVLGLGLFQLVENFYYNQIARNLILQGQEIAEMYKTLPEAEFNRQLDNIALVVNAHIVIVDRSGTVHACNSMMHLAPGEVFQDQEIAKVFDGEISVKRRYHFHFENQMLSAALPIWQDGKVNKALLLFTPVAPITATLQSLQKLMYFSLFSSIVLASILAFFFSRSISRPLIKMNQAALEMARGNFNNRIPVSSEDELGVLSASFNFLSDQLSQHISALSQEKEKLEKVLAKERKLEESRREFVANVSHELRTPIGLVQGYSEALMDGFAASQEQQAAFIKNIHEEANRLKRLVDDLLDLSRLQTGSVVLEKEWIDLEQVCRQLKEKYHGNLERAGMDFHWSIEPAAVRVWADRFRLEQVLFNLMDNAIRYAKEGDIMLEAARKEKGTVIKFSDAGEGIAPQDLPHLFDRFYRGDKSRNRVSGGTGLGLSIVKNIIEAHGGEISVESQEGKGTTFIIILP
ncbi:MAG: ATP-binding protein [Bacillota bacterium]